MTEILEGQKEQRDMANAHWYKIRGIFKKTKEVEDP